MKHSFRQDLPTKLKADFQQRLSGFILDSYFSILSILPDRAKLFSEPWLILSENRFALLSLYLTEKTERSDTSNLQSSIFNLQFQLGL
jgi:hypothetical protein